MELTLTAYVGGKDNPNAIQLSIKTDISDQPGYKTAHITLTEQEQDDLIAGVLERRGVCWNRELLRGYVVTNPISATGTDQSKIHPADVDDKEVDTQFISDIG